MGSIFPLYDPNWLLYGRYKRTKQRGMYLRKYNTIHCMTVVNVHHLYRGMRYANSGNEPW